MATLEEKVSNLEGRIDKLERAKITSSMCSSEWSTANDRGISPAGLIFTVVLLGVIYSVFK